MANFFRHKIKSLKKWAGGLLMATHPMKHLTPHLWLFRGAKFANFRAKVYSFYIQVSWTSAHVGLMFIYLSMRPCGFVYRLNWSHKKNRHLPLFFHFSATKTPAQFFFNKKSRMNLKLCELSSSTHKAFFCNSKNRGFIIHEGLFSCNNV